MKENGEDWPIGRCAVALRAFAPNTLYDCWLPLVLSDTAGEKLANSCRALVAKISLGEAGGGAPDAGGIAGRHPRAVSGGLV